MAINDRFSFIRELIIDKYTKICNSINDFNNNADLFLISHLELLPLIFVSLLSLLTFGMVISGIIYYLLPVKPQKKIHRYYTYDELNKIVDRQRWLKSVENDVHKVGEDLEKLVLIPTLYRNNEGSVSVYFKDEYELMNEIFEV